MTAKNDPNPPIYLDYHATTPVDPRVADLMLHYMTTEFGNASSTDHIYGDRAAKAVSQARSQVAELVGAFNKRSNFYFRRNRKHQFSYSRNGIKAN